MLNENQVEFIRKIIDGSSISSQDLQDDLLDHFCCFIENETERGSTFEMAYAEARRQICPNGFAEIQNETIYLLNTKKINRMKKIMYLTGLLSTMAIVYGWLANILHLPGSGTPQHLGIGTYGFLCFVLLFLPIATINYFKVRLNKALSDKTQMIVACSSGFFAGLAVIFKTLHLTGADDLMLLGVLLFIIGFLPFQFVKMYRKSVSNPGKHFSDKLRVISGLLSGVLVMTAIMFKVLHLTGADDLLIGGALFFIFGFLPLFALRMYRKSESNPDLI